MNNVNKIIVTGADGRLGGKFSKYVCDFTEYGIIAVSNHPEKTAEMIKREEIKKVKKISCISSDDFFSSSFSMPDAIGAVHLAFSRAGHLNKDIASSLDYSMTAFRKVVEERIQNAIYISSQSIYGDTEEWRTIDTIPAPNSIYAMAKYAGEKIFESVYYDYPDLQHTILRLDNVIQSQNLVRSLCRDAINKGTINIVGGKQVFSYIDELDVAEAIFSLFLNRKEWKKKYNVGPNKTRNSLIDIAQLVREEAEKKGYEVTIKIEKSEIKLWAGMDTSSFLDDTNWRPKIQISESIRNILEEEIKKKPFSSKTTE